MKLFPMIMLILVNVEEIHKLNATIDSYWYQYSLFYCDLSGGVLWMWVNRGFILAKISKIYIYFFLTFTDVHMGRQKVPKSDFQSHFSMTKIIRIFFFSLKNISLEESFLLLSFVC